MRMVPSFFTAGGGEPSQRKRSLERVNTGGPSKSNAELSTLLEEEDEEEGDAAEGPSPQRRRRERELTGWTLLLIMVHFL